MTMEKLSFSKSPFKMIQKFLQNFQENTNEEFNFH